jgi:hypothetical protein
MAALTAATAGKRINIVFNNAGYIAPGMFAEAPLERYAQPSGHTAPPTRPPTHTADAGACATWKRTRRRRSASRTTT